MEELVFQGSAQPNQRMVIEWIITAAAVLSTFYKKKKKRRRKERRGYITSELYF